MIKKIFVAVIAVTALSSYTLHAIDDVEAVQTLKTKATALQRLIEEKNRNTLRRCWTEKLEVLFAKISQDDSLLERDNNPNNKSIQQRKKTFIQFVETIKNSEPTSYVGGAHSFHNLVCTPGNFLRNGGLGRMDKVICKFIDAILANDYTNNPCAKEMVEVAIECIDSVIDVLSQYKETSEDIRQKQIWKRRGEILDEKYPNGLSATTTEEMNRMKQILNKISEEAEAEIDLDVVKI